MRDLRASGPEGTEPRSGRFKVAVIVVVAVGLSIVGLVAVGLIVGQFGSSNETGPVAGEIPSGTHVVLPPTCSAGMLEPATADLPADVTWAASPTWELHTMAAGGGLVQQGSYVVQYVDADPKVKRLWVEARAGGRSTWWARPEWTPTVIAYLYAADSEVVVVGTAPGDRVQLDCVPIHGLDPRTGDVMWSVAVPMEQPYTLAKDIRVALADGAVFVTTADRANSRPTDEAPPSHGPVYAWDAVSGD